MVWFWRRNTRPPVGLLMFLCAFEAAVAPSLQHTSTSTKAIIVLGSAGFLSGAGVLWSRRRAARERAVTA